MINDTVPMANGITPHEEYDNDIMTRTMTTDRDLSSQSLPDHCYL